MSADYNGYIKLENRNQNNIDKAMDILKKYEAKRNKRYRDKHDCSYIECVSLEKDCISFSGPWGVPYHWTGIDIDVFTEFASKAPEISFEGSISGFGPGSEAATSVNYNNGKIHIKEYYYSIDDGYFYDEDEYEDEYEDEDEDNRLDLVSDYESLIVPFDNGDVTIARMFSPKPSNIEFQKKYFAFSNSCKKSSELQKIIEEKGGKIRVNPGKTTNYFILGKKQIKILPKNEYKGFELNKSGIAHIIGITEDEFFEMINAK